MVYFTYQDKNYDESLDVARITRKFNKITKLYNYIVEISKVNKEKLKKYKEFPGDSWKSPIIIPYLDTDCGYHYIEDLPPMFMICSFGPPGSSNAGYQLERFGMRNFDIWELASRGGHTIYGNWKIKSELNKEHFSNPIEFIEN